MEQETENVTVTKPFYEYQTRKELKMLRDLFVTLMSRNSYEPADTTRLDELLESVYVGGKISGLVCSLAAYEEPL